MRLTGRGSRRTLRDPSGPADDPQPFAASVALDGDTLAIGAPGNALLGAGCPACAQLNPNSPFMTALNAGGDTQAGVIYTVIATRYDEAVTPYTSQFLTGPNVTNITLQDQCLLDFGDHLSMPYDHIAARDVLNALRSRARASAVVLAGHRRRRRLSKRADTTGVLSAPRRAVRGRG